MNDAIRTHHALHDLTRWLGKRWSSESGCCFRDPIPGEDAKRRRDLRNPPPRSTTPCGPKTCQTGLAAWKWKEETAKERGWSGSVNAERRAIGSDSVEGRRETEWGRRERDAMAFLNWSCWCQLVSLSVKQLVPSLCDDELYVILHKLC